MNKIRTLLLPLAIAAAVAACGKQAEPAANTAAAPAAAEAAAAPAEAPAAEAIKPVAGTYQLDPSHTDVLVQWTHFGFSQPSAQFGISEGTLIWDADDVSKSSVQVSIPVAAIDTFVDKLDEHLKSGDFFDAGKFPNATFKSTSVAAAGTNKLTVTGDLTIKDITKPVTLDVTLNGAGEHPMLKKQAIGFSATGTIKRSDFGVGAYAPNVSDDVQLRITTEGTLADAPAAEAAPQG
ncbi:polyisoprenoid-binding protein [Thermomonas brevis]|uniref:Polyisoprenoid-binding protein n=1 Tax=Thermomonas brevis TaxID=215691 RepID=A0A7G9QWQ2_9GAMM|nr:YceI family protein [Thermomonas brevis]QNN47777.1 polyisoprenoid-binding protein [Thermomonas brevis]